MATVERVDKFTTYPGWNSAYVRWISAEIFLSLLAYFAVFIYEFIAKKKFMSRVFESDEKKAREEKYEVGKYKDGEQPPKSDTDKKSA